MPSKAPLRKAAKGSTPRAKPTARKSVAKRAPATPPSVPRNARFFNRELQMLAFNERVLAQAHNPSVPLLERLKYLAIVSSNLDEFFEIRVAGLKEQIKVGSGDRAPDGKTPKEAFRLIAARAHELVRNQYALLNDELLPALAKDGIRFLRRSVWTVQQ
ncbi:MAG: hypothetical protein FGM28_11910, partial [Limnohabitans sp.]|nr:hypothetical protein [Limnohabitans sp.]